MAALLAVGAVAGAVIGTHILHIGCPTTRWRSASRSCSSPPPCGCCSTTATPAGGRPASTCRRRRCSSVFGIVTGILAGLLGVGGGIFMVPAMVVGFGSRRRSPRARRWRDRADVDHGHVAQPHQPQRRPAGRGGARAWRVWSRRSSAARSRSGCRSGVERAVRTAAAGRRGPHGLAVGAGNPGVPLPADGGYRKRPGPTSGVTPSSTVRRGPPTGHRARSSCAIAGAVLMPAPPWPASHQKPGAAGSSPSTGTRSGANVRSPAHARADERSGRSRSRRHALEGERDVELLGLRVARVELASRRRARSAARRSRARSSSGPATSITSGHAATSSGAGTIAAVRRNAIEPERGDAGRAGDDIRPSAGSVDDMPAPHMCGRRRGTVQSSGRGRRHVASGREQSAAARRSRRRYPSISAAASIAIASGSCTPPPAIASSRTSGSSDRTSAG